MPPASRTSKQKRAYNHTKSQKKHQNKRSKTHPYRIYVSLPRNLTPHQIHNIKLMLPSIATETHTLIVKQANAIQISFHKDSSQKEAQERCSNLVENSRFSMPNDRGQRLGSGILDACTILWIEHMQWCRRGLLRFSPYVPSVQQPISENLRRKRKWFRLAQIGLKGQDLYDEESLNEVLQNRNEEGFKDEGDRNEDNATNQSPLALDDRIVHRRPSDGSKITLNTLEQAKRKLLSVIQRTRQEKQSPDCEMKLVCKLGSVLFQEGKSQRFNMKKAVPIDQLLSMSIGYFRDMKLAFNSAVLPGHALQVVRHLKDTQKTHGFRFCQPDDGTREIVAYVNLLDNMQRRSDLKRVHVHFQITLSANNEVQNVQLERFLEKDIEKHAYITVLKPHILPEHSVDLRFKFFSESSTDQIPDAIHALADEAQFDTTSEKLRISRTKQGVYSFESIRYKEIKYRFESENLVVCIVNTRDHESNQALAEIEIMPKANVALMTPEQVSEYFDAVTGFVRDTFCAEGVEHGDTGEATENHDFEEHQDAETSDDEEDFSDDEDESYGDEQDTHSDEPAEFDDALRRK